MSRMFVADAASGGDSAPPASYGLKKLKVSKNSKMSKMAKMSRGEGGEGVAFFAVMAVRYGICAGSLKMDAGFPTLESQATESKMAKVSKMAKMSRG